MSIYELKPRFQALLRPLVVRLHAMGVTANQVTLAACVVSVVLGLWLFWVGTVIVLAGLSEFAGALGPTVGASRRYDGPLGKSDRAFVFGALGLYVALGWPLPGWAAWLMPLLALLVAWTTANRIRRALAEAEAGTAASH